jgi:hypothetical protein
MDLEKTKAAPQTLSQVEKISFDSERQNSPLLTITYSSPGTNARNSYTVRIPIPPGQEASAESIVKRITAEHESTNKI